MSGREPELLFYKGDVYQVVQNREKAVDQAIDQLDANRVLTVPVEDLVKYIVGEYELVSPKILREQAHVDQKEAPIQVRDSFSDYGYRGYGGASTVAGTVVELTVPFAGDAQLFHVRPQSFDSAPPRAVVGRDELVIRVAGRSLDRDRVKAELNGTLEDIDKYLSWQRPSLEAFTAQLPGRARARIEARKAKLLQDRSLVSDLGFPMKKRADAVMTYVAPSVKRRIEPRLPAASVEPFQPEPALDEKAYREILDIIGHMSNTMERSPAAFEKIDEEALRFHFLSNLNGIYEGSATGETFNFDGKTDIAVKVGAKSIFIAECKFWKGEKAFLSTVDQLLSYLSWRDTKTSLIIFNRNKDFGAVLDAIKVAMEKHPNTKRGPIVEGETRFRFVCASPHDANREVIVTVMAFDVPASV